jgi:hypothetical protein
MEKEELKILYDTEARSKSNTKRIDELQLITKAFYDLAGDVRVIAEQMSNMKEDISDIKIKVDEKTSENNKIAFNLKSAIINGIVMIIIGAIMALIIK